MVNPVRIVILLLVFFGGTGIGFAASVPTERVIAPRSLESVPGISAPADAQELKEKPGADPSDTAPPAKTIRPPAGTEPPANSGPDNDSGFEETIEAEEYVPEDLKVHYTDKDLPAAVKQMRQDLLEAASTGNFDRLRLIYDSNDAPPTLSFDDIGDPIEHLKESSGDKDGYEILAILIEILQAGWVHKNPGEPDEMYVWPYFAEKSLEQLTPKQKIELYEIVTASDVEEMETFGSYIFYRLGIGPDGTWYYFVAGD